MKKIALLILSLLTIPLIASLDCISNTNKLRESFDTKEWRSYQCACPCKDIKAGKCIICCHLQQARPFTVIQQIKKSLTPKTKTFLPESLEQITKNFVLMHKQQAR